MGAVAVSGEFETAFTALEKTRAIVQAVRTARQTTLLVRGNAPVFDPGWESADIGLEEGGVLILALA